MPRVSDERLSSFWRGTSFGFVLANAVGALPGALVLLWQGHVILSVLFTLAGALAWMMLPMVWQEWKRCPE